jgi:hypothetical protein
MRQLRHIAASNPAVVPGHRAARSVPPASHTSVRARVASGAKRMRRMVAGLALLPLAALADVPEIFRGADLKLGEKLIAEHKCAQCHARKLEGDGNAIYRPKGRINTPGLLRGMVEQCNTELNLGLFPEEVTAVAAVLNRDFYKFAGK